MISFKTKTNNYVKQHGILLPNDQVFLTKPLFVYKKVYIPTLGYSIPTAGQYGKKGVGGRKQVVSSWLKKYINRWGSNDKAIANLIIPAGATVNLARSCAVKLRANKAYCWNIISQVSRDEVPGAVSGHDKSFHYYSLETLLPKYYTLEDLKDTCELYSQNSIFSDHIISPKDKLFCNGSGECSSGIHFFVDQKRALDW